MEKYVGENPNKRKTLSIKTPEPKPKYPRRKLRQKQRAYFVFAEGQGMPKKLFPSRNAAFGAANLLSKNYPELRIHVLQTWRVFQGGRQLTIEDPDFEPVGPAE